MQVAATLCQTRTSFTLQCVAVCYGVLVTATNHNTLQHAATDIGKDARLPCLTARPAPILCCSVLQCVAVCCIVLVIATHCKILQHTATHCNSCRKRCKAAVTQCQTHTPSASCLKRRAGTQISQKSTQ